MNTPLFTRRPSLIADFLFSLGVLLCGLGIFAGAVGLSVSVAKAAPGDRVAALVFNSAELSSADVLPTNLTPRSIGAYRISVSLETQGTFAIKVYDEDGNNGETLLFNSGTALDANEAYTFVFGCHPDLRYNFRLGTSGDVNVLQVDEVSGEVLK